MPTSVPSSPRLMTTYVAFLRGVNLGPHRKVSMPRLAEIARELGYDDVWTYLSTGNLALTTDRVGSTVERELADRLHEEHGASVDVTVRTAAELRTVLDANPFPGDPPSQVTVAFLTGAAPAGAQERIVAVATAAEPFVLAGREVWVRYGDGQASSKLATGFSKAVGVSATTRTVGTLGKLVARLGA